jgi:flagellar hook-associated protein 1 FlgK
VASALNTGTGAIGVAVSNPGVLKPSDYALAYVGGNYTVTRLSDNATVYSGAAFPATLASEGLTLSLGGAPAAGDRFLIRPTRAAAADFAVAVTDPRSVAAAAPIRTAATVGNAGTGQVGAGVVSALDPNLQQTVTITFNNPPTTFNVVGTGTGNPVNVPYTAGGDISYNGWTVQIGGAPAAGDSFTVEANVNGVGDNRNALGLGALQSQLNLDGGTATYTDAYGALIADVATRTRTAEINNNVQSSLLAQSVAARDSVSGVNLDEEAANMLRFQQAYQAAAQMIGVADSLFQTLIVSLRG